MPSGTITNRTEVEITITLPDGRSIDVKPGKSGGYDTAYGAVITVKEKGTNAAPGNYRLTTNVNLNVYERDDETGLEFRDAKKPGGIN